MRFHKIAFVRYFVFRFHFHRIILLVTNIVIYRLVLTGCSGHWIQTDSFFCRWLNGSFVSTDKFFGNAVRSGVPFSHRLPASSFNNNRWRQAAFCHRIPRYLLDSGTAGVMRIFTAEIMQIGEGDALFLSIIACKRGRGQSSLGRNGVNRCFLVVGINM